VSAEVEREGATDILSSTKTFGPSQRSRSLLGDDFPEDADSLSDP